MRAFVVSVFTLRLSYGWAVRLSVTCNVAALYPQGWSFGQYFCTV